MSTQELSRSRLARMHDVMTGYVECGEARGLGILVTYENGSLPGG